MSFWKRGTEKGVASAVSAIRQLPSQTPSKPAPAPVVQEDVAPHGSNIKPLVIPRNEGERVPQEVRRIVDPAGHITPQVKGGRTSEIDFGGVQCIDEIIETEEALAAIPFYGVINSEVKVAAWLNSAIAVVRLFERGTECSIFIDKDETTQEVVREIADMLGTSGYRVVRGHFADSKLIMALTLGHINGDMLKNRRDIARDPTRSALFREFKKVVAWAYDQNASDIDWALNLRARNSQIAFMIGGKYVRPPQHIIKSETMGRMLGIAWQLSGGGSSPQFDSKTEQQAEITMELPSDESRPEGARLRLRWSGMSNDKGTVVTMRIQRLGASSLVKSLEQAGYLKTHIDVFNRIIKSKGGLVVFAGTVGSGKSTSLASLISQLPRHLKIQSIEDPVELEIPNAYQKTVTRDLLQSGQDGVFLSAARAIYRSALNVLYLGEVRDPQTGSIARQVVESGHTVYTTIHARSAPGVIDRFISPEVGVNRDVLGAPGIIKLMVYQALLPVNCKHCCVSPTEAISKFKLSGEDLVDHNMYWARVERLFGIPRDRYRMRNESGCEHCRKDGLPELNGFNDRTVVCEMVEPDDAMEDMILRGATAELHRYWNGQSDGVMDSDDMTGKSALECAIYKATHGLIDTREIEQHFESFETIEAKRNTGKLRSQRTGSQRPLHAVPAEVE